MVVGVVWVAAATTIAEKVSGRLGGLIVGLPSTAVVSLLFIGITQGLNPALTATVVMIFMAGLYCFYFLSYLLFTRRGFSYGITLSLLVWFASAIFASIVAPKNFIVSVSYWAILVILSIWLVNKKFRTNHNLISKNIVSTPLWFKALFSGVVISLIVLISKIAGPTWGGIFATFFSLTLATFFIAYKSGGVEFTRLIAKNVLVSITPTLGLFGILNYLLLPIFGVVLGVVISYAALLVICVPLYFLGFEKLKD